MEREIVEQRRPGAFLLRSYSSPSHEAASGLNIDFERIYHTQVEQPAAIARALAYGGRLGEDRVFLGGLDRRREDMDNIKHLLLVGCGTSPAF